MELPGERNLNEADFGSPTNHLIQAIDYMRKSLNDQHSIFARDEVSFFNLKLLSKENAWIKSAKNTGQSNTFKFQDDFQTNQNAPIQILGCKIRRFQTFEDKHVLISSLPAA